MTTFFFPEWAISPDAYLSIARKFQTKCIFDYLTFDTMPTKDISFIPFHLPHPNDAPDALSMIDEIDLPPKSTLIGHSLGAAIALKLALKNPNSVKTLILFAPFVNFCQSPDLPGQPLDSMQAMSRQAGHSPGSLIQNFYRTAFHPDAKILTPPVFIDAHSLRCGVEFLIHYNIAEQINKLSKSIQTIVLFSPQDRFVTPAMTQSLLDRLIFAQSEIIPTAGHLFPITHVDLTYRTIQNILD